jgi:hypothetical protein
MVCRWLCCAVVGLLAPGAFACSVLVPWRLYTNVVELRGEKIPGLTWVRGYNILDYAGDQTVIVSGIRRGERFRIARWQDGLECSYDETGSESCSPNDPAAGVYLGNLFGDWTEASDNRDELKKMYLRLFVQIAGREVPLMLSGRPVRTTRELHADLSQRISNQICVDESGP